MSPEPSHCGKIALVQYGHCPNVSVSNMDSSKKYCDWPTCNLDCCELGPFFILIRIEWKLPRSESKKEITMTNIVQPVKASTSNSLPSKLHQDATATIHSAGKPQKQQRTRWALPNTWRWKIRPKAAAWASPAKGSPALATQSSYCFSWSKTMKCSQFTMETGQNSEKWPKLS